MKLIKCKICGKELQGRVCSSFARSTVGERSGAQAVHGFSGGDAVQLGVSAVSDKSTVDTEMPSSGLRSLSNDIEEPALRKGHEVSRGAERKEQHPTPKPKFNKTAYQRLYMADLRAAKKIGITTREYRDAKNRDTANV